MSEAVLTGGCLCGAIRYRVVGVLDAGLCHCRHCQRESGSAFLPWARVDPERLEMLAVRPATYRSAEGALRAFCPGCGSSLYTVTPGGKLRLLIGTLDEPSAVEPAIHLVAHQQVRWLKLDDRLPWVEDRKPTPVGERRRAPRVDPAAIAADAPVTLGQVDNRNLDAVLALDVAGHQRRFVADNARSIAQAAHAPHAWYRAICAGEVPVGFIMLTILDESIAGLPTRGEPYVWRLMVDERCQGRGYGSRGLELAAAEARTWGQPSALWLSCVPGTGSPYELYLELGFEDTGQRDPDGEVILRRPFSSSSTESSRAATDRP
jgi:diamine N-acetyltransferase